MSFFPHVVVGAAVGSFAPNPVIGGLAGFISHFVLDFIPHWDPVYPPEAGNLQKSKKMVFLFLLLLDILLALITLVLVYPYPAAFWGAVAGGVVDIDNFLQYQKKFKPEWFPLLSKIGITAHEVPSRWHNMTNIWLGLFNQTWVTAVGLGILLIKLRIFNF